MTLEQTVSHIIHCYKVDGTTEAIKSAGASARAWRDNIEGLGHPRIARARRVHELDKALARRQNEINAANGVDYAEDSCEADVIQLRKGS